jgi:hypothetical protein
MNRIKSMNSMPSRQGGAAMLTVVVIFLLVLPLLISVFMQHSVDNATQGVSSAVRSAAADASDRALAALRPKIDAALLSGPIEYQSNPPSWFIGSGKSVDVRSSGFWQTCSSKGLCSESSLLQDIGSTSTSFTVDELVTPTGITDPMICGQDGFVAVFYNVFIHTQATKIPADGGNTIQSVYRSCQKL